MGGFELSGRLLRGVKYVEEACEIETDIWRRLPISIDVFSVSFLIFLDFVRIFFNVPFTHSTRKTMAWTYPGRRALKS